MEKTEWMNQIITQFWPFLDSFVQKIMESTVVPEIQKSVSVFELKSFDLGSNKPVITDVTVLQDENSRPDEIIMDVRLVYNGDAQFEVAVLKVPAGIRNIKLAANLRVRLFPLMRELPLVGAISLALTNEPEFSYDFTQTADLLDFPGVRDKVREVLAGLIRKYVVLPNHQGVVIAPPHTKRISRALIMTPPPQGIIGINVLSARNLDAQDLTFLGGADKAADPYVRIRLGAQLHATSVRSDTLNPVWDDLVFAEAAQRASMQIHFRVFDKDLITPDDFIADCKQPVYEVFQKGFMKKTFHFGSSKASTLNVALTWYDLRVPKETANPEHSPKKESKEGKETTVEEISKEGTPPIPAKVESETASAGGERSGAVAHKQPHSYFYCIMEKAEWPSTKKPRGGEELHCQVFLKKVGQQAGNDSVLLFETASKSVTAPAEESPGSSSVVAWDQVLRKILLEQIDANSHFEVKVVDTASGAVIGRQTARVHQKRSRDSEPDCVDDVERFELCLVDGDNESGAAGSTRLTFWLGAWQLAAKLANASPGKSRSLGQQTKEFFTKMGKIFKNN